MATLKEDLDEYRLGYLRNVKARTSDIFNEKAGTKRAIEETAFIYEKNALGVLDSREIDVAKSRLVEGLDWLGKSVDELAENVLWADELLGREYSTSFLDKKREKKEAVENGHRSVLRRLEYHDAKDVMRHIAGLHKSMREMESDLVDSARSRERPLHDAGIAKTYFENGKTQLRELYSKVWHLMSAVHTTRAVLGYSTPDEELRVGSITGWKCGGN